MSEIARFGAIPQGVRLSITLEGTAEEGVYRGLVVVNCTHKAGKEELKAKDLRPEFLTGTLDEIWRDMTSGAKLSRIVSKLQVAKEAADAKAAGDEKAATTKRGPGRPPKNPPATAPATQAQSQLDLEKEAANAEAKKPLPVVQAEFALDSLERVIGTGDKGAAMEQLATTTKTCGLAKEYAVKPEYGYLVSRFKALKTKAEAMSEVAADPFA